MNENKRFQETIREYLTMITSENQPKKVAVDRGTKSLKKNYAKRKEYKFTLQ